MDIAIVIPCYKRIEALSTLCQSLLKAGYGGDEVTLVFSIDYAEGSQVYSFAESFQWPFGKKEIIRHPSNIGLRNNIISCGSLTEKFDAVILLEDDLEVMPSFYQFAKQAAVFYDNDDRIGGISIYQYYLDELTWNLFLPIDNGSDVYFVKWASSWGQLWTKKQWKGFIEWYAKNQDISSMKVPRNVRNWRGSWKKYYIAYLTDTNRYFVFPRASYVYNGNKVDGTHTMKSKVVLTSSPLETKLRDTFTFIPLDQSNYKYDSFFQLESGMIRVNGREYQIDYDLFGHKEFFSSQFAITSRKCKNDDIIYSFDAGMLPIELNILYGKPGDFFFLVETKNIKLSSKVPSESYAPIRKTIRNWHQFIPLGIKNYIQDISSRIIYHLNSIFSVNSKRKYK